MNPNAGHFRLGLFVLTALIFGSILLVAFGAGSWFTKTVLMETYFDESVQGLDVGSKVKYRGVTVGEISKISFTHTKYQLDQPAAARSQYVLVESKLQPELFGSAKLPDSSQLAEEVARGLRVRIAPQGLTGTNYLEIDFTDPAKNPPLPIAWQPQALYIPSARSAVVQIVAAAQNLVSKLERINFDDTITKLNRTLDSSNKALNDLHTKEISEATLELLKQLKATPIKDTGTQALALMSELRDTNRAVRTLLTDPALASAPADLAAAARAARKVMENPDLPATLAQLEHLTRRLDQLVANRDQQLESTLDNLHAATGELRLLIGQTRSNPSSLLFGAPPQPYPLPTP
ncbi:paraquat-inducible protein B [Andreprevotia lacus DSM 23236]|jgi:ABC-type transporter Mla subunit MlaD|uniref:Paraquat-inducible protein B n=1 Tax=Andreprevotia lacus DSM 23236 TaxID=1121001 RepID=A0A1W1XQD1_9NEIS|nr:MlaD family protein [Andreprevotia lacus]SMC26179.1 paraquat-inducible protein B [Andreprevotia lacus DSM 23236]